MNFDYEVVFKGMIFLLVFSLGYEKFLFMKKVILFDYEFFVVFVKCEDKKLIVYVFEGMLSYIILWILVLILGKILSSIL